MLVVNPRHPPRLDEHALLWGRATRYYVPSFPGPLSIKSVPSGAATWTTDEARHEVREGSYLVVNDAHRYTLEIEAREPVETFCVFFARGFIEDAVRCGDAQEHHLLDEPDGALRPTAFREALQNRDGAVGEALDHLKRRVRSRQTAVLPDAEDALVRLALALSAEQQQAGTLYRRIEAAKPSTRDEIFRRLCVARDVLDGSLDETIRLPELARAAHLSPFHLHRHFRKMFGETPQAYRTRRRLERAAASLRSSGTAVTDVALDAGFSSLGSFSSLFKRRFGASPVAYRKRAEKEQD